MRSGKPRGRPRSEAARQAILAAAAGIIVRDGPAAVTMEAVARLAGVGKPTIYRSWPNREQLVMAALMAAAPAEAVCQPTASPLADLSAQLRRVIATFATPHGRAAALMVAAAERESELAKAFRSQVMLASREDGRVLLERAIACGEVRADLAVELMLDMLYGAIFYRLTLGHAPLDASLADDLLAALEQETDRKAAVRAPGWAPG